MVLPAAQRSDSAAATPTGRVAADIPAHAARAPFIALVLALLAGGLVCLLVINTTLAAASFQISHLQRGNAQLAQQVQSLQQQVATDESPTAIAQRARRLGMREQPVLRFLDLRAGRIDTSPHSVPGVAAVPGYTP